MASRVKGIIKTPFLVNANFLTKYIFLFVQFLAHNKAMQHFSSKKKMSFYDLWVGLPNCCKKGNSYKAFNVSPGQEFFLIQPHYKPVVFIVIVIVVGNGVGVPSSNPGRGCLRFTFTLMPLRKAWIYLFSQLWMLSDWAWYSNQS